MRESNAPIKAGEPVTACNNRNSNTDPRSDRRSPTDTRRNCKKLQNHSLQSMGKGNVEDHNNTRKTSRGYNSSPASEEKDGSSPIRKEGSALTKHQQSPSGSTITTSSDEAETSQGVTYSGEVGLVGSCTHLQSDRDQKLEPSKPQWTGTRRTTSLLSPEPSQFWYLVKLFAEELEEELKGPVPPWQVLYSEGINLLGMGSGSKQSKKN